MKFYRTKVGKIKGKRYSEVYKKARAIYDTLNRNSKRKAHVRSIYFKREKIFLDLFWSHLFEKKSFKDQIRRLRYYNCALNLIKNSTLAPTSKLNKDKPSETLHRFSGTTLEGDVFFVQIKENNVTNKKWLISVFPSK